MAKDYFSARSKAYAAFRPTFPDELYRFIVQNLSGFDLAWDVATGNGQSAIKLAPYFKKIIATDISENQLAHAVRLPNIEYRKETAEQASLEDHSVDLVTISQALHWLNFDTFYREVRRVVKPGGLIAAFVYSLLETSNTFVNEAVRSFYFEDTKPYWDAERKWVDEGYETLPFPFKEIASPRFSIHYEWDLRRLVGYLETWSACQHYQKQTGKNIVEEKLLPKLRDIPVDITFQVRFPVFIRAGRV